MEKHFPASLTRREPPITKSRKMITGPNKRGEKSRLKM